MATGRSLNWITGSFSPSFSWRLVASPACSAHDMAEDSFPIADSGKANRSMSVLLPGIKVGWLNSRAVNPYNNTQGNMNNPEYR